MREFKIAVAGSRKAGWWKNTTITWQDLCARLSKPVYTSETSDEYWAMNKDDRDAAKDKGGFVGGRLKNGRRRIANVECRSLITLDVDHAEMDFLEMIPLEQSLTLIVFGIWRRLLKRQVQI